MKRQLAALIARQALLHHTTGCHKAGMLMPHCRY
jgi:hypothetical protein